VLVLWCYLRRTARLGGPGAFREQLLMSGQPTDEWKALGRAPYAGYAGKEQSQLRNQLEALLALITDPLVEGAWLDVTGRDPVWVDATEARRKAGLPDIPGRRVVGQGHED
jgi:hypothetical protein